MPHPKTSYRSLDFGNYLHLIMLDTDHDFPVEGVQTAWLKKTLSDAKHSAWKMAVYHVAGYPSYYPYNNPTPEKIRANWCPLFDQYGLQVAFENHNHTFKRTWKLKNQKVDENGVLYLGDGSWGVSPRKPVKASKCWYLAKSASKSSVWLTTLLPDGSCHCQALGIDGEFFDEAFLPKK